MSLLDTLKKLPDTGPDWLAQIRRAAADGVKVTGLPHRKVEAWRFTPVKALEDVDFAAPEIDEASQMEILQAVEERLGPPVGARMVLINGRPLGAPYAWADGAMVRDPMPGIAVNRITERLNDTTVREHLGRIAPAEHFSALNAALFEDGLVIEISRGASMPLEVVHVGEVVDGNPTVSYPRLLVLVDEGAEATLIETYLARGEAKQLVSAVTEIELAPAARLEHVRVTEGIASGHHIAALAVTQQRGSFYGSRVVTFGGALSRVDLRVRLVGQGAECELSGAYHADGKDVVDHHTRVEHVVPNCTSNEEYRGIIDGSGHAVFDATAIVHRDAQHTVAHQENRNLLLSDGAGVNTKPHLEIDADDVVCSHGATVGALDEESMYYLRARGIGEQQATAMLTYAFVRSVLDAIRLEPVRARLADLMLSRLPYGDTIKEMTE